MPLRLAAVVALELGLSLCEPEGETEGDTVAVDETDMQPVGVAEDE